MINMKAVSIVLSAVVVSLCVAVPAQAQISNMDVGAGMQILRSSGPDMAMTQAGATSASVDLTQPTTGIHVQSSMAFSSVTADSAVFDFLIGMHGNGYQGDVFGPAMGGLGDNGGHLYYTNTAPATWTLGYVLDVTGSDTYGMQPIDIYLGRFTVHLGGVTPTPGHYSGTQTFDVGAGTWGVDAYFSPNVGGGSSFGSIDGQYAGTFTFNFGPVVAVPVPVPEPETYAMLLGGLGLLGFAARRRKQKAA